MTNNCKCDRKPVPADTSAQAPTAKQCDSCGLDYCDCEVCDEDITVQVKPAK